MKELKRFGDNCDYFKIIEEEGKIKIIGAGECGMAGPDFGLEVKKIIDWVRENKPELLEETKS